MKRKKPQPRKPKRSARGLLISAGVLSLAIAAIWLVVTKQPYPHTRVVKANASSTTTRAGAGVRAFMDPATGLLREPTAEEEQALIAAAAGALGASAATAAPVEFATQSGGYAIRVPDDAQGSLMATKAPDGTIGFSHVSGSGTGANLGPATVLRQKKEVLNDR